MTAEDLRHQIDMRRHWIKSIEERLPYADGPAWSQDKRRISTYEQEIRDLERKLKERYDDAPDI